MRANSFDHVALWVDDRDNLSAFLCEVCGMHEIERQDTFTLVGGDARRGKLTLFDAEGPREPGVLERIGCASRTSTRLSGARSPANPRHIRTAAS